MVAVAFQDRRYSCSGDGGLSVSGYVFPFHRLRHSDELATETVPHITGLAPGIGFAWLDSTGWPGTWILVFGR